MFQIEFGDFATAFLGVLFEGVPFLLLGSLISGFVDVFVSSERITRMLPRSAGRAIWVAALLGFVVPMCECGSVIVVRRFIRKGLPFAVAATYMLAAPIVSPLVALSTWKAFTGQQPELVTALRLGFAFLIAVLFGFIIHQLPQSRIAQPGLTGESARRRTGLSVSAEAAPSDIADFSQLVATATPRKKVILAVQSATADFLDVAFYFVIGAAITSVFKVGVNTESIAWIAESPLLSITGLMLVAALFALCSTTDAFIAATQFGAFSLAAKMGFMLFGPVFDLKLFWLYGLVFKRRFILVMALGLFILIAAICWIISGAGIGALPRI